MVQPNWPTLDDLTFQNIVDRVKNQIAIYCPEWTDHNVSDPGVTLIELFAGMTEMLLYRVNRLPEHAYRAFLDLIGARLDPARPALTDVTFYLTAAPVQKRELVTIEVGTEVSTIRTDTTAPIVFSTTTELKIRPASLRQAYRVIGSTGQPQNWESTDLSELPRGQAGQYATRLKRTKIDTGNNERGGFSVFAQPGMRPIKGNALYLELGADHSMHVLAVTADCVYAAGEGAQIDRPPWIWEVSTLANDPLLAKAGALRDQETWAPCVVERDETGGFNFDGVGDVVLRLPVMSQHTILIDGAPRRALLLRCRLTEEQDNVSSGYAKSPIVRALGVRSIGGSVPAQQASIVRDEQLGLSDGTPYQTFRLRYAPLLARHPNTERLEVHSPDGTIEPWDEVEHFASSGPTDRHYTLDSDGTLRFGPLLAQPNGKFKSFGTIPVKGSELRFKRYRYGGGVAGNVLAETLVVRRSADPRVARVTNWENAVGGRDAQSVADARLRAPAYLRTRTRAVTADDFVELAEQIEGVHRSTCLNAGGGTIHLVVLPALRAKLAIGPFPAKLEAKGDDPLLPRVQAALEPRALLGLQLEVKPPRYVRVQVIANLICDPNARKEERDAIVEHAFEALYRFLNPHTGGPDGKGWPFGRRLSDGMVKRVLQEIPGVDTVGQVLLKRVEPNDTGVLTPGRVELLIPVEVDQLICSYRHEIKLEMSSP